MRTRTVMAAALAPLVAALSLAQGADSAVQTQATQAQMTPAATVKVLKDGNARFLSGQRAPHDFPAEVRATASGQYPYAAILSCMDSRAGAEIVFDQGLGDIFNLREAGNVVDIDALGGLEYAVKVVGVKLIVVMGHSHCGAIKGAVDGVELGNLTALVAKIHPAVVAAGPVPAAKSKDDAYVQKVAEANVRQAIKEIRERSPIIRDLVDSGKVGLVGAMYDIETGKATFAAD